MTDDTGRVRRRGEGRGKGEREEDSTSSSRGHGNREEEEKELEALKAQPWYWPYTTREEAERMMVGQPEGSFMIRHCSMPRDFTLTVRNEGCSKCVRIYKHDTGYSLQSAGPTGPAGPFPSLPALVEHYRRNSLSAFNKRLSVRLLTALTKPAASANNQYGVFKELYDLSQEQLSAETRLSILQQQRVKLDTNLKVMDLMLPALRVVKQMYLHSMAQQTEMDVEPLNTKLPHPPPGSDPPASAPPPQGEGEKKGEGKGGSGTDDSSAEDALQRPLSRAEEISLTANTRLLMSRHTAVSSRLYSLTSHCDLEASKLRELDGELQAVGASLLGMKRRHDELIRHMVQLGCKISYLTHVLEPRAATREFDRSTWLLDCSRDEALAKLDRLPHGAFLVRRKDKRQLPYVLSIVVSMGEGEPSSVQHCYVVRPQGRGYGFNAALAVFQSVDQLVLRHRHVSLRHYFSHLDVTLAFPVGCQELLRRSSEVEGESVVVQDPGHYANAAHARELEAQSLSQSVGGEEEEEEEKEKKNSEGADYVHAVRRRNAKKNPYEDVENLRRDVVENPYEDVDNLSEAAGQPRVSVNNGRDAGSETTAVGRAKTGFAKDHQYEYVENPDSGATYENNPQESMKIPLTRPVKIPGSDKSVMERANEDFAKRNQYEYVENPDSDATYANSPQESVKKRSKRPVSSAMERANELFAKQNQYEYVESPDSGVKSASLDTIEERSSRAVSKEIKTKTEQNFPKDNPYESVGERSKVAVAESKDPESCHKEHVYEAVDDCDVFLKNGKRRIASDSQEENVYEPIDSLPRHLVDFKGSDEFF